MDIFLDLHVQNVHTHLIIGGYLVDRLQPSYLGQKDT